MTGTSLKWMVPYRSARCSITSVTWAPLPSRYRAMISSSMSAQDSTSLSCHSWATFWKASGMSIQSNFWPFDSSSKTAAFILMRSMMPLC